MTERSRSFIEEQKLRAQALDKKDRHNRAAAVAVLVDFYEEHGQLSRAALWRQHIASAHLKDQSDRRFKTLPDLLTQQPQLSPVDNRRNQMIWLLRMQGVQFRVVGDSFGLSLERIRQVVARQDRIINLHSRNEQMHPTLKATERLIAAGALPGDQPTPPGRRERWFGLVDEPPADWPAEHKRGERRIQALATAVRKHIVAEANEVLDRAFTRVPGGKKP